MQVLVKSIKLSSSAVGGFQSHSSQLWRKTVLERDAKERRTWKVAWDAEEAKRWPHGLRALIQAWDLPEIAPYGAVIRKNSGKRRRGEDWKWPYPLRGASQVEDRIVEIWALSQRAATVCFSPVPNCKEAHRGIIVREADLRGRWRRWWSRSDE